MNKSIISAVICFVGILYLLVSAVAQEEQKPEFIGTGKCKICHSKVKMGGIEYYKWEKGPHAKAYESLASEESKKMAQEIGVTDPQNDEKCLKCHITDMSFDTPEKRADGIGCERCHGAGSLYKNAPIMKDYEASIKAGMRRIKGSSEEETMKNAEALCRECHGLQHKEENPAAKEFNFKERWEQIKHDEETLKAEFPDKM